MVGLKNTLNCILITNIEIKFMFVSLRTSWESHDEEVSAVGR